MTPRAVARVALGAALALLAVLAPAPASPAGSAPRAASGRIELRGQPAWSSLGDDVPLRLSLTGPAAELMDVQVVVHSAVLSRIAFERSLRGSPGSVVTTRSVPVAALPPVGTDRVLTLGLQDPDAPRDPSRIRLSLPGNGLAGVFPLEVQLREPDGGSVVSRFVTELVAVRPRQPGEQAPERLAVAWLWRVTAPVSIDPDRSPNPDYEEAVAGRIGRIAQLAGEARDVPITLVPDPETIRSLPSATDGGTEALARFRSAAGTAAVVASPYVPVRAPALLRDGLARPFSDLLVLGQRSLERDLAAVVDRTVTALAPLDTATLLRLRTDAGVTRVVVHPDDVSAAPPVDQYTPARPFRLDTEVTSFDAVETNDLATSLLRRPGSSALRAQQLLAGLSVIALEQPNASRGVVIDTPRLWDPAPARVRDVLAGLRDHPLLAPRSVADLFETVPPATTGRTGSPYVRTLAPVPAGRSPVSPGAYRAAERDIDALRSMLPAGDPLLPELRANLRASLAGGIPNTGVEVSTARLTNVVSSVRHLTDGVTTPATRSVTLTSRKASVPISIDNATDRALRVRVRLASQKLEFPDGDTRLVRLPPGKNDTTVFDVTARATGTFPVEVVVSSPDQRIELQHTRYTVRSAAVSGVGVFLTVGAGLFLAGWWITHWRRSRRTHTAAVT